MKPRLTEHEIAKIKRLFNEDGVTVAQLAKRFDVSERTIRDKLQREEKFQKENKTRKHTPKKTYYVYFVVSPKGEKWIVQRRITDFCIQHNLCVTNLRQACDYGYKYKGWSCFEPRQLYYEFIEEHPELEEQDDFIRLQD